MKKIKLMIVAMIFSISSHAQFVKAINHFSKANHYQTFVYIGLNGQIEVVSATNIGGDLNVSTSVLDSKGEVLSYESLDFNLGASVTGSVGLTGVFDENDTRILMFDFYASSTKKMSAMSFSKTTGSLISYSQLNENFKLSHIKSIRNGNELVQYAQLSSGEFNRVSFNISDLNITSIETVDVAPTLGFTLANFNSKRSIGELELVNGIEISAFHGGVPRIYKRNGTNNYSIIDYSASNPLCVSIEPIGNNELVYFGGNYLLKLDANLNQIDSVNITGMNTCNQATLKFQNTILLAYNAQNLFGTAWIRYDLNLDLIPETTITMLKDKVDLPVLQIANNNLLLSGKTVESIVNTAIDGTTGFNSKPVYLNAFSSFPDQTRPNEFHYNQTIDSLNYSFGLGYHFITENASSAGVKTPMNQSVAYNITNVFSGILGSDTLGKNSSGNDLDYLPGPYTDPINYNDGISNQYALSYFVSKEMIEYHLDSIQLGSSTYVAPHGINYWPAHGNTAIGQAENLAPFVDVNSNGIYEPYLGDYPSIYGTHCLFSIAHQNPNSIKNAGIEVHSYIYWFEYDTTENFVNIVFQKNRFIPRTIDFAEFKIGTYADFDIGNNSDDYNGTNVALSTVYAYNGDPFDESNGGTNGFGTNSPIAGIVTLRGAKRESDGLDNPGPYYDQALGQTVIPSVATALTNNGVVYNGLGIGYSDQIIDNEFFGLEHSFVFSSFSNPEISDPTNSYQWNNYLSGNLRFGDTLRFGGNGFNGALTVQSKYCYSNQSDSLDWGTAGIDPGFAWSEQETAGSGSLGNPPGDRRFLTSGGMQAISIGEVLEFDIAFIYHRSNTSSSSNTDSILNLFFNSCDSITSAYRLSSLYGGVFDPIQEDLSTFDLTQPSFFIYPNPTSNQVFIKTDETSASLTVLDINGKTLLNKDLIGDDIVSVVNFEAGLYFFVFENKSGFRQVKKVVKE